jgi:glycosyltransferase involved in cell wall biosynthesis
MSKTLVSVITPVYNEEAVIKEFFDRTLQISDSLSELYDFEFVFVDDGSQDQSLSILKSLASVEPRLRVAELRKNYGQTAALQAGIDLARGSVLITLDSDLQHFPEEIPYFLEQLEEGYDMVCGWRHRRQEGIIRRWPSRVANRIVRWITKVDIHDFGTTFRAYRMELVNDLRLYGEFHRFIPALGASQGGRITEIPIRNIPRPAGRSSYGIGRTVGVFLDLMLLFFIVRYLDRPMRAFGKLGLLMGGTGFSILSFMVAYAYVMHVSTIKEHLGWFLLSILLIVTGMQVLIAGLLSELLIRIHFEQHDGGVYRIRKVWNEGGMTQ